MAAQRLGPRRRHQRLLSFPGIQLSQSGGYSCVISNIAGTIVSAVATVTVSELDSDGDGLPDAWELAHGLDPEGTDAGLDPDEDGMTSMAEFIAGTHPRDATSFLRVELNQTGGEERLLFFTAVSNRTYSVVYRDAVETGSWLKLLDVAARPTNRVEAVTDPAAPGLRRFYRLVTPAMP